MSSHPYVAGDEPVPGYRLLRRLGKGGFGEVWEASAPGGAHVALKVVPNLSGKQGQKEFRAIGLVKGIHHAHLVPIFAVWLKDEGGHVLDDSTLVAPSAAKTTINPADPYETQINLPVVTEQFSTELLIAMGLGHKTLVDRLRECVAENQPGIPYDELLDYMEQSARALDYLNGARHALGDELVAVQHCDVKPQNLLIVGDSVQICDFGLARVRGELRKTAEICGSFAYTAPECLVERGEPSAHTDQYSLAISYFELRTGNLPYPDDATLMDVLRQVTAGNLNLTGLPPRELAVLRRATSREPDQRFPSNLDFVSALREAGVEPVAIAEPRRTPWWPLAAFVASAALAVLAAWYVFRQGGTSSEPALTAQQYLDEGTELARAGKYSAAEAQLSKSLLLDGGQALAWSRRGYVRLELQDYANAVHDFEQARRLEPNDLDTLNLAIAYLGLGDLAQAENLLDELIASGKEEADARYHRAKIYLAREDWPRALADLRIVVRSDAPPIDALRLAARLLGPDASKAEIAPNKTEAMALVERALKQTEGTSSAARHVAVAAAAETYAFAGEFARAQKLAGEGEQLATSAGEKTAWRAFAEACARGEATRLVP